MCNSAYNPGENIRSEHQKNLLMACTAKRQRLISYRFCLVVKYCNDQNKQLSPKGPSFFIYGKTAKSRWSLYDLSVLQIAL